MKKYIIKILGGFSKSDVDEAIYNAHQKVHIAMSDYYDKEYQKLRNKLSKYEKVPSEGERIKYNQWLNNENIRH